VLAVTTVTQELDAASGGVFEFRLYREAEMVAVTLRDDQERAKG